MAEGNGGTGSPWRGPGRGGSWNSPGGFRGNKNYNYSPRYQNHNQGGGGWQRSPGPYQRYQNPRHHHHQQNSPFPPPFLSSTPIHHQHQQRRPYFRGGGNRFNSPRFNNAEQGIEAWVSPSMWDDPWKEFTQSYSDSDRSMNEDSFSVNKTKFANLDSDFSFNDSASESDSLTLSTELNVSDMIMRSADFTQDHDQEGDKSSNPVPDIDIQSKPTKSETDNDQESAAAKNLLTLITS